MNWITNYVRPRINSIFSRREMPENLWSKCDECGTMLFHRELAEALFRTAFEHAPFGMALSNADGRYLQVNPAFCKMHGYTCQELVGQHPTLFIRPDDHPLFGEYLHTVRASQAFHSRAVDLRKDGTPFHVEVHGTPFTYRGKPHILGVVRDVTERLQARQLLEEQVAARTRELSALYGITAVVSASLDLNYIMEE